MHRDFDRHRVAFIRRHSALLGPALGILLLYGCTKDVEKPTRGNVPPETYLSIRTENAGGTVTLPDTLTGAPGDTALPRNVDYRLILHWWGTDPDGKVTGYRYRWIGNWTAPLGSGSTPADTAWIYTTATVDTFAAPTGVTCDTCRTARSQGTFYVEAIDDQDAVDPTPAKQGFRVRNRPPSLRWDTTLPAPTQTLPATSFAWHAIDFDGRSTVRRYRYWLDGGDSLNAPTTADTVVGLFKDDFAGRYGARTINVQAIDESQTPSNVIRRTWNVLPPPSAQYLLVDNVSSFVAGGLKEDSFYRDLMDSTAAGNYYILDFEATGGFRSSKEALPVFSLFSGVVWYSGLRNTNNDALFSKNLALAETGIGQYLDQGGRLLLVGSNAVGDSAGLSLSFASSRLGVTDFFRVNGTSNMNVSAKVALAAEFLSAAADTVVTTNLSQKADYMLLGTGVTPLFSVPAGFIAGADSARIVVVPSQSHQRAYLGALAENGTSRLAILTFLLSRTTDSKSRPPAPQDRRESVALFRRVLLQ